MNWFIAKISKKEETKRLSRDAEKLISEAYYRNMRQIDSLRKYDKGEKEIDAPDLSNIV